MIKKVLLTIFILNLVSTSAYSQNENINIENNYFNIDFNMKLLLINKNIDELNASHQEPKTSISSNGKTYSFTTAVSNFKIGNSYKVKDSNGNMYKLYFTQLPIINITTNNTIIDEPRVYAHFSMQETNGNITENAMGIEIRGASSQVTSKKKSYRIEFWENQFNSTNKNLSLLNMRNDDDWNLQAMPNEPLRIRSKVGFELWRKIDTLQYNESKAVNGIRQEYVELFLNSNYLGIYILGERIDRKQLQLKKFENNKIEGELYKGINWGNGATRLNYAPNYNNNYTIWDGFKYQYPSESINWSNLYGFVDFVINADNTTFYDNYESVFDVDNAVNYFLFLNLLRATDNTGKNLFIAKYKENDPYFYIPWDLDGTFGIIWTGGKENVSKGILTNGLYNRLILDTKENGFVEKLKNKWSALRTSILSKDSLLEEFNVQFNYLKQNGVYDREIMKWGRKAIDYDNINYTNSWLQNRLTFLDNAFGDLVSTLSYELLTAKPQLHIYPNPASQFIYVDLQINNQKLDRISIYDYLGRLVSIENNFTSSKRIDISALDEGMYLLLADFANGYRQTEKLIIKK